jgi:osmoprotectant transport system substrate-binding protein
MPVLALAACGGGGDDRGTTTGAERASASRPGAGKPAVTLGDKNFTEQIVLGELYEQALEAKGFRVRLKANIGSSEIIDKALTSGTIDVYPEYTGVIVQELQGEKRLPGNARATYEQAKRFEERRGYTLLDRTPFQDRNALAARDDFAQRHSLSSIPDLAKVGRFSLVGPPEFRIRRAGLVGLRSVYHLTSIKFQPLGIGKQYAALAAGKADVANVFTTDGALRDAKVEVLEDPKNVFGFQNVAPIVSPRLLERQGPAFARTLNAVSARLTTGAMRHMNAAVDIDKKDPGEVARTFLRANRLVP